MIKKFLVLFRFAQSICFLCKVGIKLLQDLLCKSAWLDRSRIRLDRSKLVQIVFFLQNFQLSPSLFDVQGFMFYLKYKRENPSHVLGCSLCCVCESFVRSRGGLHTYLGFPRFKIMSRTWRSIQLLIQGVKETQVGVLVLAGNLRKKQSMDSKLSPGRGSKFPT